LAITAVEASQAVAVVCFTFVVVAADCSVLAHVQSTILSRPSNRQSQPTLDNLQRKWYKMCSVLHNT